MRWFGRRKQPEVYLSEQDAFDALVARLSEKFPDQAFSDYPDPGQPDYNTALLQTLQEEQRNQTEIGRSLTEEGLWRSLSLWRQTGHVRWNE